MSGQGERWPGDPEAAECEACSRDLSIGGGYLTPTGHRYCGHCLHHATCDTCKGEGEVPIVRE